MKLQCVFLTMITASTYSCGSKQEANVKASGIDALPGAAIIAVQDDPKATSEGLNDDLRTLAASDIPDAQEQVQEQQLPIIYEKAKNSETIVTQGQEIFYKKGLRGWFHYRSCPGRLVRLVESSQQEPVIMDSCQPYHLYQPVYVLGGRAHRFFFHRAYKVKNVTYYYYVNQVSDQQTQEQNTQQTESNDQKQHPEQKQEEQNVKQQQKERQTQCQKQIPTQKNLPTTTKSAC